MQDGYKRLRMFVASPRDAQCHRDIAIRVATEVSKEISDQLHLFIDPFDWTQVAPNMGTRAEDVILNDIEMGNIDIFVGILWQEFGNPTGRDYESGTEEEFYKAHDHWISRGSPRIMFYFDTHTDRLPTGAGQIEQYSRVLRFKELLGREKGALYRDVVGPAQFEKEFRRDLLSAIRQGEKNQPPHLPQRPQPLEGSMWPIWRDAFCAERQQGERTEAFLYKTARSSVKFMTISGRSVYSNDVEAALSEISSDNFLFQLLLFDWTSPHFETKMRDERRTRPYEIEQARDKARSIARQFIQFGNRLELSLQVRLYSDYPVWRIMVVDDATAYVGCYPMNKRGYEGPMIVLPRDTSPLFYPMHQYFDKYWEQSGPSLTLADPRLDT